MICGEVLSEPIDALKRHIEAGSRNHTHHAASDIEACRHFIPCSRNNGARSLLVVSWMARLKRSESMSWMVRSHCRGFIMCQKCVELTDKYFPGISDRDRSDFLMGATCFPFGDPEQDLEPQLADIAQRFANGELGNDLVGGACAYADAQITAQFELERLQAQDW